MRKASFLLIDAGNTRFKWATANPKGPIRLGGNISTTEATSLRLHALAKKHPLENVVVACVVPRLAPLLRSAFGSRLHLVSGRSPALKLDFDYPKPAQLGADRLAAAVAAHAQVRGPVIVVNCGTATAFSVLDRTGKFCGGVIAPGLEAQLESLIGRTGQLPSVSIREPRRYLARSTDEAIRAGLLLNFRGGVNEIIKKLSSTFGKPPPRAILTGGTARYLVDKLDCPATLQPLLVFKGLRIIATRLP